MLFISESSVLPALCMLTAYSFISSSVHSRSIISFIPSTAFMGVRISWDICARKLLFASSAAIAESADCFSCRLASSCMAIRLFVSMYTAMMQTSSITRHTTPYIRIPLYTLPTFFERYTVKPVSSVLSAMIARTLPS